MRKVGFITTNRVFAQSCAAAIEARPDLGFIPLPLLNPAQALLDAEIMQIDLALLDISTENIRDIELLSAFCKELRLKLPGCRIMLLAFQNDKQACDLVRQAMKGNDADDFVYNDTSLEYLFAKLASL